MTTTRSDTKRERPPWIPERGWAQWWADVTVGALTFVFLAGLWGLVRHHADREYLAQATARLQEGYQLLEATQSQTVTSVNAILSTFRDDAQRLKDALAETLRASEQSLEETFRTSRQVAYGADPLGLHMARLEEKLLTLHAQVEALSKRP